MKKIALALAASFIAGVAYAGAPAAAPAATAAPAAATTAAAPAAAKVKGEGVYTHAEDLKFEWPMGDKGPGFAFVTGDMKSKGKPATFFLKTAAGFDSSWHTHDSDYTAVVVKGIMTHQVQGGVEQKLTAGSVWTQPAKINHTNKCLAEGGECIAYITVPKGFSFTPKTAEGKDVPKPAEMPKASGGSH